MALMLMASVLFLGTHIGISSTDMRPRLVDMLGERGYLAAYAAVAGLALGYLIWIYAAVPRYEYFWLPSPALYLVPKIVMPVAAILLVGGFMTRNPTAVGMEGALQGTRDPDATTRGLTRITRHPFQWSVVLWAVAHMAANGDRVSVVFFGTFLVLGLAGGPLIDRKKASRLGADWEPFARSTSNVPFAAILAGRNRLVARELIAPVTAGLLAYGILYLGHPWIAGVRVV